MVGIRREEDMKPTLRRSPVAEVLLLAATTALIFLLFLVWGAGVSSAGPPWSVPEFDDVGPTYGYHDAIMDLREHGSAGGYADNTFRPENPLWRAQFAKFIVVTLGMPDSSGYQVSEALVAPFTDLGPDDPADLYPHDYIAVAADRGVTLGTGPGTFSPWVNVKRCQVVTMAVRATLAMFPSALTPAPLGYVGSLGMFDATHGPAMALAEYNDLTNGLWGYGPGWDPWVAMTRGEAAQVLWNLLGKS
jgi:hypothetical protein